jgi:hypothetical protein
MSLSGLQNLHVCKHLLRHFKRVCVPAVAIPKWIRPSVPTYLRLENAWTNFHDKNIPVFVNIYNKSYKIVSGIPPRQC